MTLFGFDIKINKRAINVMPITDYKGISDTSYYNTANKIVVNEKNALMLSAVWACVKVPSESLASMPSNFFYKNKDNHAVLASDTFAHKVLKNPNPFMTSYTWKLLMTYCYRISGNAYSQIIRGRNNEPLELIPIHPSRVEPIVVNDRLIYKIDSGDLIIESENMIHFKGLTSDGIVGISPIKAQAQNISLGLATQLDQQNFYEKGSSIDIALIHPDKLDPTTVTKTRLAWKAQHSGVEKSRVAVIDSGFKLEQLKLTAAEMQYLEARKATVPEIARIFTVPLHKIQDMGASTNNNIEQQGIDYVTDTIMPMAICFEQELETKLLSQREKNQGFYCKINLNGLMRGDFKTRMEGYRVLHSMGVPLNSILRLEDMNPVDGGDISLAPLNMIEAQRLTEYHFAPKKTDTPKTRTESHTLEQILQ